MSEYIAELQNRVASLGEQLRAAEAELLQARLNACPVKPGMIVLSKGAPYLVVEVRPWSASKAWVIANPLRKDGNWGTARRNLYGNYTLTETDAGTNKALP